MRKLYSYHLSRIIFFIVFLFIPLPLLGADTPDISLLLSGKPVTYADVAVADFDGDGFKEIIAAGSDGMLYVVSTSDGLNWSVVWSHQCNDDMKLAASSPPPAPYDPGVPSSFIYPIAVKDTNVIEVGPAVADLDNDGHLDIVVAMGGNIHKEDWNERGNGGILVYRYLDAWNFQLSGDWPQPKIDRVGNHCPKDNPVGCGMYGFSYPDGLWDGIMTSPAIGDIDGDGDLEIVVAGIDRRIHAWHHTGEPVAGWPIYRYNGDALLRGGVSSPALADIDADGLLEVVVGTMSPPWDPTAPVVDGINPDYNKGTIWAINGDSTNVPGWPVATEQLINSSPAINDINNDGKLEIVIGSGRGIVSGRENIVYAFKNNGTLLPGWPVETAAVIEAPPALGDIDNDGRLEIVVGCGWIGGVNTCGDGTAKLYAFNDDGTLVSGFPTQPETPNGWLSGNSYSMPFAPILADIDGDNNIEIIMAQVLSQGLTIVGNNGVGKGFRKLSDPEGYFLAAPLVDDIDNDGKLEIVAAGGATLAEGDVEVGRIFIWDEIAAADAKRPWPMNRFNSLRTGGMSGRGRIFLQGSAGVKNLSFLELLLLQ